MLEAVYIFFFALTVLTALLVVFSRHAVHAALFLIVMMISIAGIFVLINAQLAAFLQIIVYAGAIMVLFLFVIMLLNLRHSPPPPIQTRNIRRFGVLAFVALLAQVSVLIIRFSGAEKMNVVENETASMGEVALFLLTRYLYAFEITSVLILVAIVGAMALARRGILIEDVAADASPSDAEGR